MKWTNSTYHLALVMSTMLSLSACQGLFDDIYDKPTENVDIKEGQLYIDASSWIDWFYIDFNTVNKNFVEGGTSSMFVRMGIPLNNTNIAPTNGLSSVSHPSLGSEGIYTYWYDVFGEGLSKHEFRNFTPTDAQPEPESWHIAVHRNNVRTNGGAAYETSYTSMADLPESSKAFADATFTEDEWNELDVWTVQQQMLNGLIGNQGIKTNPVLSSWIKVSMPPPPVFTLNNHVFIVKMKDGTFAAIQLENYQSPLGVKCCLTINYKYPY